MSTTLEKIKASAKDLNSLDPKLRARAEEIKRRYQQGLFNAELEKEGAKPVPIKKPNFEAVDMSTALGSVPQQEGQMSKIPEKGFTTKVIEDIPSDFSEMGETLRSGLEKTGQNILDKATKEDRSLAEKATMVGGETLKGIGRFVGNSLIGLGKLALPQSLEDSISEGVEKFGGKIAEESLKFIERVKESDHPIDQAVVAKLNEMVNRYKTDERFRDQVDAGAGFAQGLLELYGTGKAVSATKEVAETIVDTSTAAYRATAPVVTDVAQQTFESAKDVGTKVIKKADELSIVNNANRVAKQEAKVDEAVARIIQGTPEDIATAKKALMEVDTDGVKTYADLNTRLDDSIETLAKKQDAELAKYTEVYPKDQLARYKEVKGIDGKTTTVSDAPIVDALNQLDAYYSKIGDVSKSTVVKQYINKLNSTGLTVDEMNKIARMHGVDLNAYNANGELASGLTKQAAENTRQGVKETLRQRLPDEVSKGIDESLSNLYATRKLTQDMETKVQKLYQKVKNRTLAQKVGGAVADVVDLASFGTLRGFVQKLLPSNVGLKTANSMDLEKELSKNLAQIDKLLAIKDEKKFTEAMAKYLEEVQPGLSTRVTSGLSNAEKDALLGKLNNIKSTDVTSDVPSGAASGGYKPELDIELSGRLDELKAKSEKAGGLTEREYAELKVLMDEVELNTNQTIAPSFSKGEIPTTKGAPLADTSGGFEGQYLYHGTSEQLLDSIAKDGLKPGMRGQLSLSKDEGYARSYAEGSKFPAKKGQGVVFRVNSDLLKGKTTTKRLDGKERQFSDQKNELLTKETIPPEAIEILKDGKWQPLVEHNPLYTEARKYKSVDSFIKSRGEIVYHGTPNADKITELKAHEGAEGYFGNGIYLTREMATAKRFTKLENMNPTLESMGDGNFMDVNTGKVVKGGKPDVFYVSLPKDFKLKKITIDEMDTEIEKFRQPNGVIDLKAARNAVRNKYTKQGFDGFDVPATKHFDEPQIVVFPQSQDKIKLTTQLADIWKKANGQK